MKRSQISVAIGCFLVGVGLYCAIALLQSLPYFGTFHFEGEIALARSGEDLANTLAKAYARGEAERAQQVLQQSVQRMISGGFGERAVTIVGDAIPLLNARGSSDLARTSALAFRLAIHALLTDPNVNTGERHLAETVAAAIVRDNKLRDSVLLELGESSTNNCTAVSAVVHAAQATMKGKGEGNQFTDALKAMYCTQKAGRDNSPEKAFFHCVTAEIAEKGLRGVFFGTDATSSA